MKHIKIFLVVLFIIALAIIILINNILDSSNQTSDSPLATPETINKTIQPPESTFNSEAHGDIDQNDFETKLIEKLKANYLARIDELTVQASLINIKRHVLSLYPNDGEEIFERIIRSAFPSHASAILLLIERLEAYNLWLMDNQIMLSELSTDNRDGAVWVKRREIFGDDADILWSADIEKAAQKQKKIHDMFQALNDSDETTLDEKLYQLQTIFDENIDNSVQALTINAGSVAQAFFSFDSVQNTLKSLSPEDRQLEINRVRRQLGYDEETIVSLQEKDAEKNKRWENGLSYMQARQTLEDTLSEDAFEAALPELRQKYFGTDANTIGKEEQTDFFRFKRPRVYGRN